MAGTSMVARHTTDEVGEVVSPGHPPRVRNLEQVGALPTALRAE